LAFFIRNFSLIFVREDDMTKNQRTYLPIHIPNTIWVVMLVMLLVTCKREEDKGELIAKVGQEELYSKQLEKLLMDHDILDVEDSASLASSIVNGWIEKMVLVETAKNSKIISLDKIDRRASEFRNDLIIYEYLESELNSKLDTSVSPAEIEKYYKTHKSEFQLNDYLVKVLYLKIPLDAPEIEKIGQAYKLNNETDLVTIEEYAKLYASNFYYDLNSWIYFDDLLKEIPLHDIRKDKFILKRSKVRFEENGFYYFLNIVDYKLKNTISPLSFESNNIKQRIINSRTKVLRESIKEALIKNAYEQNLVKEYKK
jgi:hypothetical protein